MKKYLLPPAILAACVALSGCATTEAVKQAQATADQALMLANQGIASAQKAQVTADSAVTAAQRAQETADSAQNAAAVADAKAQAAGDAAAKADKTFWDHHNLHHRHRRN